MGLDSLVNITVTNPRPTMRLHEGLDWGPIEGLDVSRFPAQMQLFSKMYCTEVLHTAHGPVLSTRPRLVADLQCIMTVRDRDYPDRITLVTFQRSVSLEDVERRMLGLENAVYDFIREAVLHELDECWLVNGIRTRDPHAGERR